MSQMHSVQLSDEISARLTSLAKATKRTKSHFLREALERSLEDLEDAYLAETAHENFLKNKETAVSLEDVVKELGLGN